MGTCLMRLCIRRRQREKFDPNRTRLGYTEAPLPIVRMGRNRADARFFFLRSGCALRVPRLLTTINRLKFLTGVSCIKSNSLLVLPRNSYLLTLSVP